MENTAGTKDYMAGTTTPRLPRFPRPLSSFPTDFPASHPPLWPCAAAPFASENEFRFAGG